MYNNLIFRAQALDNKSSYLERNGEEISNDNDRQQMVANILDATLKGKTIFDEEGVRLIAYNGYFTIEVLPTQLDHANRESPITCYGEYHSKGLLSADTFGKIIFKEMEKFAKRIEREIKPNQFHFIQKAFFSLARFEKKRRKQKKILIVGITLSALTLIWLLTRNS